MPLFVMCLKDPEHYQRYLVDGMTSDAIEVRESENAQLGFRRRRRASLKTLGMCWVPQVVHANINGNKSER